MLIILSGPSGAGKNTVIEELLKDKRFMLMPTFTTRQKREGEKEGKPYFFVTKEKFLQMIDNNEFYEYEFVHNKNYYGTHKQTLQECLKRNKIMLKDIDVLGTLNLKKVLKDIPLITIFLKVESPEVLRQRLISRGETDIENRLERYEFENKHANLYDHVIINNDLQKTVNEILKLL